jgi:hypothetical protein
VQVDFLIPPDDESSPLQQNEFIFLSRNLEGEFAGQGHVAVAPALAPHDWTIVKVGQWEDAALTLKGPKVALAGFEGALQRRLSAGILVQSVQPPALESVVLKVSDAEYEDISEDHETFRRFCNEGMVFRAGKSVTSLTGVVVETTLCEPVNQGVLGDETEIILVTESQKVGVNGLGTPFSTSSQNESNSELDITQFLALPESEDPFGMEEVPVDDAAARGIPLRVNVLERPVDKFSLEPRPGETEDDEFRVYANMRDIARIGVFSGDWVLPNLTFLVNIDFPPQTKRPKILTLSTNLCNDMSPRGPPHPPHPLRQPL